MVTDNEVLTFFQDELPILGWLPTKDNAVGFDDVLQDYTEQEDLIISIEKFGKEFDIDLSRMDIDRYFPWKTPWFFRKWFTNKAIIQTKKPLTVKMFADSAKAGKWLYE
ncbi:DUF1493 family protein [Pantoea sp. Sc1]|uniref:DUF1493 family protein n=1 Tax=Pantoea sp. Sc1 TaxID=593105 RepID=UPI00025849F7|nr:DUF1493 family protein [Pantoea sp. Sc1]EIC00076.1 hypothetical protein S7A_16240 [Pantoea sp. Sc1]